MKRDGCQKTFDDVEEGCNAVAADWKAFRALGGCGDGQLKLWDMGSGEVLSSTAAHPGGVWAVEANWAKKRVASGGDEHFKVWNIADWTCVHKIDAQPGGIMSLRVDWIDLRALVGVGAIEQGLRLLDLDAKNHKNLVGHRDAVAHIYANWENDVAVSGGWDAQLRVWNLEKGSSLGHDCKFGRVRSVTVDFNKMQAVCGSSTGSLHGMDLQTGAELWSLDGHIGGVTAVQARV